MKNKLTVSHDIEGHRAHVAFFVDEPLTELLEGAILHHLIHSKVLEDRLKVLVVALGEIGRVADAVDAAERTTETKIACQNGSHSTSTCCALPAQEPEQNRQSRQTC